MTALGLVALLLGEWQDRPGVRVVSKPMASLGFVVAAISFGALESSYGCLILTGLVLGGLGDVCLLGRRKKHFITGLVSFLLGHLAFVVAFGSLPVSLPVASIAAIAVAVVMVIIAGWVFPHAPGMRVPIGIYLAVIGAMCVAALGAGASGAAWMIPVGAVLFTVSDVAVVRDRFVAPGFVNRLWGLPLYYAAQWLIAWSIAAPAG